MRRLLLRLIGITAAIVAAVLVWVVVTLPPAAIHPPSAATPAPQLVAGAYHIHSARSDGSGDVDAIAAAAARAGLRFIIVTDHGDATRAPDPPAYRHGVLCIDAVEVSTAGGHVVALNLRAGSPFPLAGNARDVIDDIHRLGGWTVAAHPDSPREELRWRGNVAMADGIEWFNADSEWRRAGSYGRLAAVALRSIFRGPESIATLFQTAAPSLARWDTVLGSRDVFGLAAIDAHARLGQDADGGGLALSYPAYETMFRTVTQTVDVGHVLSGDAAADADALLSAIRAGRSYSVVRAFIDAPAALTFSAVAAGERVDFAGALAASAAPATFTARVPAGTGARLVLLNAGREVASGLDAVDYVARDPGAYRVEARLPNRPVPWIVSNPIRLGDLSPLPPGPGPNTPSCDGTITPIDPATWVIEKEPSSTADLGLDRTGVRLRYRLGSGKPAGQFVALSSNASGDAAVVCIAFTASSARPMRLSVQIRVAGDQRWQRSVYVGPEPTRLTVPLRDLEPAERRTLRPIAARVQSILLVVDTLNTLPGTGGEVLLQDLAYVAAPVRPGSTPR